VCAEKNRNIFFKEQTMLIRKLVIAGFVLAAVGLTATVATVVIGQQPGDTDKNSRAAEKIAPAAGTAEGTTDLPKGSGLVAPPGAGDGLPAAEGGSDAGSASSADDDASATKAPAKGPLGTGTGSTSGGAKGRGKGVEKKPRSSAGTGAMMPAGTMPGMPGMSGGMSGMPGMPGMMAMMAGGGSASAPVSEDEHLETWVNQAIADYARTEDQDARKQQREQIAKALDRIFDIRQERRMEELETLEQRVQKLRGTLETREKLKSDILKNRLDYLIREADGLGWGDGLPASGRSAPTGIGPSGGVGTGSRSGGGPPAGPFKK
jgi:hypothetical protein